MDFNTPLHLYCNGRRISQAPIHSEEELIEQLFEAEQCWDTLQFNRNGIKVEKPDQLITLPDQPMFYTADPADDLHLWEAEPPFFNFMSFLDLAWLTRHHR